MSKTNYQANHKAPEFSNKSIKEFKSNITDELLKKYKPKHNSENIIDLMNKTNQLKFNQVK